VNSYLGRLGTWLAVLASIKGRRAVDRATLRRSFLAGLRNSRHDLDNWQNPELVGDAAVAVKGIGLFDIRGRSDDLYHVLPRREAAVLRFLDQRFRPGDTFVDAGANIGFFSIFAARKVGQSGKVIAVEMMPDTAAILRRHVALNGLDNVAVVEAALSDRAGEQVEAFVTPGHYGQATIIGDGRYGAPVTVKARTIDDVVGAQQVAVIKLDLEGAESLALAGATVTLAKATAVVFEQIGGDQRARHLLEQAGFRIRALDGNNLVAER
jgi:FkbM family methyltransferase